MKLVAPLVLGLTLVVGAAQAQVPTPALQEGTAFLVRNAADPAVKTLPSGLQYRVVKAGPAGPSPKRGDVIKVHYEGSLLNGQVFDSTFEEKPALMFLEELIPAWVEALPLMKVGDEWIIYAPPSLGYGSRGVGPIPANSVLTFRLQLLGMLSAD